MRLLQGWHCEGEVAERRLLPFDDWAVAGGVFVSLPPNPVPNCQPLQLWHPSKGHHGTTIIEYRSSSLVHYATVSAATRRTAYLSFIIVYLVCNAILDRQRPGTPAHKQSY
jgi:hypothetical protein